MDTNPTNDARRYANIRISSDGTPHGTSITCADVHIRNCVEVVLLPIQPGKPTTALMKFEYVELGNRDADPLTRRADHARPE